MRYIVSFTAHAITSISSPEIRLAACSFLLNKTAILDCARQTNRVLIVHEDSKTGGIGQSLASIIAEEAFEALDAPVCVLGALDAPVPYSPTLEEAFLVSEQKIEEAARRVVEY